MLFVKFHTYKKCPFLVIMDFAFENISEEDISQQLLVLEDLEFYTTMNDSGHL
jgi:hypothetical protein